MYAFLNPLKPLSEAYFFNCSVIDGVRLFLRFNPAASECLVFADTVGKGRSGDLRFMCLYKKNQLNKLKQSFSCSPERSSATKPDTPGSKASL